jgi:hypothetical protein
MSLWFVEKNHRRTNAIVGLLCAVLPARAIDGVIEVSRLEVVSFCVNKRSIFAWERGIRLETNGHCVHTWRESLILLTNLFYYSFDSVFAQQQRVPHTPPVNKPVAPF